MMDFDIGALARLLQNSRDKRVLLTFHSMGDTDSIASAVALCHYFSHASIIAPDMITFNAKRLLARLELDDIQIGASFEADADMVMLLDVNNFEACGKFEQQLKNFKGQIAIIDHHAMQKLGGANVRVFNSEQYNSTTSIVYDVLKRLNFDVDRKLAKLIAMGIIADSAEFRNADSTTFIQIGELLGRAMVDYPSLIDELETIPNPEVRQEVIEDMRRAHLARIHDVVYLKGEARAAANLRADYAIKSGVDIALFYTQNRKEISFSVRMRPTLDKKLDLHMGRVMQQLAFTINGNGGGHPCAAGAYGTELTARDSFIDAFEKRVFHR